MPHVVVLAGGEGRRLSPLTRALYGNDLPKQFAVLAGSKSLMQTTVERALLVTTADRVSVVVTIHQAETARAQLRAYPGVELVIQPCNLDTGPGLLLPLVRILARDSNARVVFLPSDHYVRDDLPFVDAITASAVGGLADRVTLIGVEPAGPEREYGWIVSGQQLGRSARIVASFAEKPSARLAEHLYRSGALWNTFISTGPAQQYWELAREHLPHHAVALEDYALAIGDPSEQQALVEAFREMPPANFSSGLLARAEGLAVIAVRDTGWSDWGSPARVFASLVGSPEHETLVERLRGDLAIAS
jgi:mannose-1-phosphate guanylyltransferase